jgi:superfamily II DNA helicase RecQ/chemotaxis methyl-accepting protein methylase
MRELGEGAFKLVYVAPERLARRASAACSRDLDCPLVAVDEAHCISEWGHDFRPEYLQIGAVLAELPKARVLACTATATPIVRDEILERWACRPTRRSSCAASRGPNLSLRALEVAGRADRRRGTSTPRCAEALGAPGAARPCPRRGDRLRADAPQRRAGGRAAGRARLARRWCTTPASRRRRARPRRTRVPRGALEVVVATNAFGMGIDRADVRAVVHLAPPASIEAYYQEVGRAGRDGEDALGLLLLAPGRLPLRRRLLELPSEGRSRPRGRAPQVEPVPRADALGRGRQLPARRDPALLRRRGRDARRLRPLRRVPRAGDGGTTRRTPRRPRSSCARRSRRWRGCTAASGSARRSRCCAASRTRGCCATGPHETRTFGILRERSDEWLLRLLRRCVTPGWVDFEGGERPVVKLTAEGAAVMRGEKPARLLLPPERRPGGRGAAAPPAGGKRRRRRRRRRRARRALARGLFEALRAWRLERARAESVPPYVVASDRTLRDIAAQRPRNREALQQCHGIGPAKAERYGEVLDITDGIEVRPDHVYVTRPSHKTLIVDGRLRLGESTLKRGHRCPVDDFFRSLAAEQKEHSIAVVLSGTGSNGTAGAQAIKAAGGLCIAQEPGTAEYPDMPANLLRSGYADAALPADRIAPTLHAYASQAYLEPQESDADAQALLDDDRHYREILAILRTRTHHAFQGYKKPMLLRRIQRRIGLAGVGTLADYAALLRDSPDEPTSLANDLLISVTGFFRDPPAWEALRESVVRPLIEAKSSGDTFRAWVTACSSGEEAYSLAMLVAEEAASAGKALEVKIFATDTADRSLALARAGSYPTGIEGDIPVERLDRFFDRVDHTYRIRKEIRDMVVFAAQDVLSDPPFSRLDLCTCRNLLIYLEPETQARVMAMLHFALRDGGYLFLGNAETLGPVAELFEVVSKKWRLYRRTGFAPLPSVDGMTLPRLAARPAPGTAGLTPVPIARALSTAAVQRALLEQLGPPTVVVDARERVVYYHGDTAPYLMQSGEPTRSLFEMVRPGLRTVVRGVLAQALAERRAVVATGPEAETPQGRVRIRVSAAPLIVGQAGDHVRIGFEPMPDGAPGAGPGDAPPVWRLVAAGDAAHEDELRALRLELQQTVEATSRPPRS